jgi:TonB-dependent SusC/RagA subfamily outer membrane receptor
VVQGHLERPKIPFQTFQEISGQVKSLILSRPVTDSEILILMKNAGVGVTSTDKNGSFVVQDLLFPDSTTFYIRAANRNGRDNVKLFIDQESFPKPVYVSQNPLSKQHTIDSSEKEDVFISKAEQRAKFDDGIWTLHLKEVEVTAPRIKKDERRLLFWANQSSTSTITREQIERYTFVYVSDYVRLASGGTRVNLNGSVSLRGNSGLPLVFIDGFEQDWPEKLTHPSQSPLERVAISAIESIDVFSGSAAIIFGMRGANGAISITTKKGQNTPYTEKSNHTVYSPIGYQKPVEFYAPKYETLDAKQSSIPDYRTTIFWKPDVVITDDGEAGFEFYTSDFPTTYSVVIEGLTNDGKIVRQVETIVVSGQ